MACKRTQGHGQGHTHGHDGSGGGSSDGSDSKANSGATSSSSASLNFDILDLNPCLLANKGTSGGSDDSRDICHGTIPSALWPHITATPARHERSDDAHASCEVKVTHAFAASIAALDSVGGGALDCVALALAKLHVHCHADADLNALMRKSVLGVPCDPTTPAIGINKQLLRLPGRDHGYGHGYGHGSWDLKHYSVPGVLMSVGPACPELASAVSGGVDSNPNSNTNLNEPPTTNP